MSRAIQDRKTRTLALLFAGIKSENLMRRVLNLQKRSCALKGELKKGYSLYPEWTRLCCGDLLVSYSAEYCGHDFQILEEQHGIALQYVILYSNVAATLLENVC